MKKILILLLIPGAVIAEEPFVQSPEDIFQNAVTNMALIETSVAYCSPSKEDSERADSLISWATSQMSPVEQRRMTNLMEDRTVAVKSRVLSKGASVFCESFGFAILSSLKNGEQEFFTHLGKSQETLKKEAKNKEEKPPTVSDKYNDEHGKKEFGIGIFDKNTKRESGS